MRQLPAEHVPEHSGIVGFFGSQKRAGHWIVPRRLRVVSTCGAVVIDLTAARVGPGTSVIDVRSILGSIEIIVPPDLRVECKGSGVLGNFELDTRAQQPLSPDAPTIVVEGMAFLGNVEVKVVDPNAPGFVDRLLTRITG